MDREYGIWLTWNNQQELYELPVLPGEIGSKQSGDGAEHEVFGLGKINVIKDRGLTEYTIESIFPSLWRDTVNDKYLPPYITAPVVHPPRVYIEFIMNCWDMKRPLRLVAVTPTMDINTPVSIEGFEWKEVAGSPDDIQYSLQLKEYKFYAARRTQAVPRLDARVQPRTYTLVAGDTLWKVAQKILGDGSRWRELQQLNGISDAQVKTLPIGLVLKLPAEAGGGNG